MPLLKPLPTTEVLKKVFTEGIESVPKKALDRLFKHSKKKLYRIDVNPKELMDRGWDPERYGWLEDSRPPIEGLYWTPSKKLSSTFLERAEPPPIPLEKKEKYLVEGLMRPGSKVSPTIVKGKEEIPRDIDFLSQSEILSASKGHINNPEEFKKLFGKKFYEEELKKLKGKEEKFVEVIQLSKNSVLAKWGNKYKILGVGGLTTAAGLGLTSPEEAEAGPLQDIDDFTPGVRTLSVLPKREDTLQDIDTLQGMLPSRPARLLQPPLDQPLGKKGALQDIDTLTPSINLPPAPGPLSQDPRVIEKFWDTAKEFGWDLALMAAAGAATTGIVTASGGTALPFALPITGAIYGGLKVAQKGLAGKPLEPTLTETLTGQEVPPYLKTPMSIAEETAIWSTFPFIKPAVKGLIKGVEKVSQLEPLKPVTGAIWENIFVKPFSRGPVEATAFGAGAGALAGGLTSEDPLTGALTGAGIGGTGMAGVSGIAKMKGLTSREMFQPAIERIREKMPVTGGTFRATRAQQSLVRSVAGKMIRGSETLLPTERIEFMKGLDPSTPLSALTSSKAKDLVMRTIKDINAVTKNPYAVSYTEELSKLMTKPIEAVESAHTPGLIKSYFRSFERVLAGKPNVKLGEIEKVLGEMIRSPRVPKAIQDFAKDLYNLPAQIPVDVAKASTHASTEYLLGKLIKTPGVVSSVMKPGYVASKHPSIKGLFVDRDIELELEAMKKVPQMALTVYNEWFMSPWKTNKIILRPAAHFRNLISNWILNDWGGLPFYRVDMYAKAAKELHNQGPIFQELNKFFGGLGTFAKEETGQLVSSLRYGAKMPDKLLNLYDKVAAPARAIYSAEESWFKLAKYMHNLEKGMPKGEAAYDAMKWTFNYGEVTPAVAKLRSAWWGAPFATWQTKVLPLMAETAVKHPLRIGKWIAFGMYFQNQALQSVGLSDGEWGSIQKTLPEYMQKGLYLMMPWRDEKQQLKLLNLTWMVPGIGDISEMIQRGGKDPLSLIVQNPLVGAITTLQSKKKYSGAPLYYDWEHPTTKAAKSLSYLWEMWSPAPAPGNVDWRSLWDAIQEKPEALTTEEAIAGQFGFRLTTVNPRKMARRKESLKRIYETEVSTQMKRELRKTKDPTEVSEILDKYRKLRLQVREVD